MSFAGSGEAVGGDAQFDQFVDDGFRAGFTQCLVGSLVASAVGMAFDGEFEIGVFFHQGDDTVDFTHTLRFDGRFADIEGDTVGDEFTVRHHAVVQGDGAFGDADVLEKIFAHGFARHSLYVKPSGLNNVRSVCHSHAIDIHFPSTFVERHLAFVPTHGRQINFDV